MSQTVRDRLYIIQLLAMYVYNANVIKLLLCLHNEGTLNIEDIKLQIQKMITELARLERQLDAALLQEVSLREPVVPTAQEEQQPQPTAENTTDDVPPVDTKGKK